MLTRKTLVLSLLVVALITSGALVVLAHGDEDHPEPDNEGFVDQFEFEEPLTYYDHIKPIFDANCIGCHVEGQIAGDIALTDPEVVAENAEHIADLVSIRYMPPWMPSPETVPLRNPRILEDEDIAKIIVWAQSGAELGESDGSDEVVELGYTLPDIRKDYVFEMDEPYTPDDNNIDDYRCFIADPEFTEPQYVTGYVFEPDQMEMVHHGIVYLIRGEYRNRADRRNGADGNLGWSCYNSTQLPDEVIMGTWTPGTFPVDFLNDTGYLVEPGDFFVMQIHYWTGATRVPDNTSFYLELEPTTEPITPLITFPLQAPVEIPCPEGVDGPQCDRDNAIAYAAERYGLEFSRRPDYLLRECGQTIADYADTDPTHAVSTCEFTSPWLLRSVGVLGHMHELGTSFRLEVNPDSDNSRVLLDIPDWDFHWQDRYQFELPVFIMPGDTVR